MDGCKLLLEHGANPLVQDEDGQTPLDYAITCERDGLIELLEHHIKSRNLTVP